jgi:hypothetical protein
MSSTIERKVFESPAAELAALLATGKLYPAHYQRNANCWDKKKQERLIDSMIRGKCIPEVLVRELTNGKWTLEDGLQRLTAIMNFLNGKITWNGKKYSDITVQEKQRFNMYSVPIQKYRGTTDEEAVEMFMDRQDGSPLNTGEKENAIGEFSDVVRYTIETLMSKDSPLFERGKKIWGERLNDDKRHENLANAVALVLGCAFGVEFCTTNKVIFDKRLLYQAFDASAVTDLLSKIIEIHERVEKEQPLTGKAAQNNVWNRNTFNGFIIDTLKRTPMSQHSNVAQVWVDFLVAVRVEILTVGKKNSLKSSNLFVGLKLEHAKGNGLWGYGTNYIFKDIMGLEPPAAKISQIVYRDEVEDDENEVSE